MYHWMTQAEIQRFLAHLRREERSPGTLAKYRRDLLAFAARLPQGGRVDKEQVLAWKEEMARGNALFAAVGWPRWLTAAASRADPTRPLVHDPKAMAVGVNWALNQGKA